MSLAEGYQLDGRLEEAIGNQPHIAYTIVPPSQGCGDAEQLTRAGTYHATMVEGKWTT